MKAFKKIMGVLGILFITVFAAACGYVPASGSVAHTTTVRFDLKDTSITPLDAASAPQGLITFIAKNSGTMLHEMVVLKTDTDAAKLAVDSEGEVSEDTSVGEISDLAIGDTKSLTLDLKPGHYVLVCNIPGHYALGMHTNFTVTP